MYVCIVLSQKLIKVYGARAVVHLIGHLPCMHSAQAQFVAPTMIPQDHQDWPLSTDCKTVIIMHIIKGLEYPRQPKKQNFCGSETKEKFINI